MMTRYGTNPAAGPLARLAGCLLIGAGVASAAAAPADDPFAQAMELRRAFKNAEALPLLERAHAANPTNVAILTELTWACGDVGQDLDSKGSEPYYERAVVWADKLKALAPDRAETCFQLCVAYGNLALFRGGREKVRLSRTIEQMARRAVEIDPAYSPPYAVLGVYYREVATLNPILRAFAQHLLGGLPSGTLEDSARMFEQAIARDPANVYAHFQYAQTREELDDTPDKAAALYRKVLELPIVDHQDATWRRLATERLKKLAKG